MRCVGSLHRKASCGTTAKSLRSGVAVRPSRVCATAKEEHEEGDADARLSRLEASRKRRKALPSMGVTVARKEDADMPAGAGNLWSGERGALYWLNKVSYASVFILVGGWIVFRFVGPAVGLYTLTNELGRIVDN